jgi:hypothetical protein
MSERANPEPDQPDRSGRSPPRSADLRLDPRRWRAASRSAGRREERVAELGGTAAATAALSLILTLTGARFVAAGMLCASIAFAAAWHWTRRTHYLTRR